ncbi:MAG: flagellar biosynthesis protein FlhA [Limnobacter sp.]|jgi:flagellar biosynthesis protein FlhA|uniref:Flagellar biosynthesis protein FlhA n=2 Tax=Pseudomonadota TaxID=1224 RepID=A0ABX6N4E4_9BURK|nr:MULTISPECIES: flagellar biosynthesis protein FlhA [unclassified Limnobacter]MAG82132.1 flagellar biosynthesis protein FlhA [Sutterellaceae bacterium]MBA4313736.1 flagellar biosynthesis protein FlhA [Alcaligenaceae bacterium]PZO13730.1 MAG: flagellar biosynthesis protein FlhA [Betaproteobacteria bacterium]MBT82966.1 flagellar biosynthesis protein FlhA [Sutterellaceae bacterium]MDP3272710.1 flagellar biosynthesis protein FlhA [Limnobacter sp.]|tara:strand:- start:5466 stop:7586 length:2121 start_codon:yes stop_codon:yes gene_type:complete
MGGIVASTAFSLDFIKAGLAGDKVKTLGAPIFIILILVMMILPVPPFALDLFFTFNIAISLMVLVAALYTTRPLDFAAFPTILLVTTLLRLSLNVASTRVVLMHGHEGPDAAGKVIEAFGHFLVGGNLAVGIVVFVILMLINFVVITKGAGRIAEVSARFTLDAMPGKQMAIDADLNAGLIAEDEARKRRAEVSQEAEFFGSMDGASKFVRGDAMAGIMILIINIIGGFAVGVMQHDMTFADAGTAYVLLAIGDGLVAQVPALVISIAAGLVVARVGQGQDIGTQLASQLLKSPQAVGITAGIMALLGIIPGMPTLVFLLLAGGFGYLSYHLSQKGNIQKVVATTDDQAKIKAATTEAQEATWDDLVPIDTIALEVGYRLIALVDNKQDGDLLKRIKAIRKKFAQEIGFLPPAVHLRDNLELRPSVYRILLKGVCMGEGEVFPNQHLAINPGRVTMQLPGPQTTDPAFGLPAVWISDDQKEKANAAGYTVVDASTVVATHLSHILQTSAAQLLGRTETQQLLDHCAKSSPKVVEDLTPKLLDVAVIQKVLQNLLEESVHIRDLRTIFETLLENGVRTKNPLELTAAVRIALGRAIVQALAGTTEDLNVLVMEPKLEQMITHAHTAAGQDQVGIDPNLAENLARQTADAAGRQEQLGQSPVLLVPDALRLSMARLLKRAAPNLRVLSHSEIPENRTIRVAQVVGAKA